MTTFADLQNKTFIRGSRGWNAHSYQMKALLGLGEKAKIPAEGMPARVIQGITVYVLSLVQAKERKVFHRVRAICPHCAAEMSAGRMHQHKCKTK